MGQTPQKYAPSGFSPTSTIRSTRPGNTSGDTEPYQSEASTNRKQNVSTANLTNLTVVKRSNKHIQALNLPVVANINPRSVYNKVNQFKTFVEQEEIDVVFMSESWEREQKTLHDLIKLEDHEIVSNVFQRKGKGGRPAIIVNNKKFVVQNLTNTLININWELR